MNFIGAEPTAISLRSGRHVFRSRLEARWAIYFDRMGMAWQYEPFRFLLNEQGLTYTPDFQVEGIGIIEVKPHVEALAESIERIERYIAKSDKRVYCFCGSDPFSGSVGILAKEPLQFVLMDEMQRILVLAGKESHEAAQRDFAAVLTVVRNALAMASRPHLVHDALSIRELISLQDGRGDRADLSQGMKALQRILKQSAKPKVAA